MIFDSTEVVHMDQEMISLFQPQSTSIDIFSNGKFIEVVAQKGCSHKLVETQPTTEAFNQKGKGSSSKLMTETRP